MRLFNQPAVSAQQAMLIALFSILSKIAEAAAQENSNQQEGSLHIIGTAIGEACQKSDDEFCNALRAETAPLIAASSLFLSFMLLCSICALTGRRQANAERQAVYPDAEQPAYGSANETRPSASM